MYKYYLISALLLAVATTSNPQPQALIDKVIFWEAKNNELRLRQSLQQLFKVLPYNPLGLISLIRLEIRQRNFDEAQWALQRLQQWPKQQANYQRLHDYIKLLQQQPQQPKEAQLLAKGGRAQLALNSYQRLFPHGAPTPALQLEMLRLTAQLQLNPEQSRRDIKALYEQYPDQLEFELVWLNFQVQHPPLDKRIFNRLNQLSFGAEQRSAVSQIWRDALAVLTIDENNQRYFQQYLS